MTSLSPARDISRTRLCSFSLPGTEIESFWVSVTIASKRTGKPSSPSAIVATTRKPSCSAIHFTVTVGFTTQLRIAYASQVMVDVAKQGTSWRLNARESWISVSFDRFSLADQHYIRIYDGCFGGSRDTEGLDGGNVCVNSGVNAVYEIYAINSHGRPGNRCNTLDANTQGVNWLGGSGAFGNAIGLNSCMANEGTMDTDTGLYGVLIKATYTGGTAAVLDKGFINRFKIKAFTDGPGKALAALANSESTGQTYPSALQNARNLPSESNNFTIRMRSSCSQDNNQPLILRWHDADHASASPPGQPADPGVYWRVTVRDQYGALKSQFNSMDVNFNNQVFPGPKNHANFIGGQDIAIRGVWPNHDIDKGDTIVWTWYSIQGNNGLQVRLNYDTNFYDSNMDCPWELHASSAVQGGVTSVSTSSNVTFLHSMWDTGAPSPDFRTTVHRRATRGATVLENTTVGTVNLLHGSLEPSDPNYTRNDVNYPVPDSYQNGDRICEWIEFTPHSSSDNGTGSSTPVCVTISSPPPSSSYSITPTGSSYEKGSTVVAQRQLTFRIDGVNCGTDTVIWRISGPGLTGTDTASRTLNFTAAPTCSSGPITVTAYASDQSDLNDGPVGPITYTASITSINGSPPGSPISRDAILTVYEVPYVRFYGHDIYTTSGTGGDIFFNTNTAYTYSASAVQYASIAAAGRENKINTAAFRTSAPVPSNGLRTNWTATEPSSNYAELLAIGC